MLPFFASPIFEKEVVIALTSVHPKGKKLLSVNQQRCLFYKRKSEVLL